jgi:hypothetical protein
LLNVDPLGLKWVPCGNMGRGIECWVPDPIIDSKGYCVTAECAAGVLPNKAFSLPTADETADFLADLSADSGAAALACGVGGPEFWPGAALFGVVGTLAHVGEQSLRSDPAATAGRLFGQLATTGLPPYIGGPVRMLVSPAFSDLVRRNLPKKHEPPKKNSEPKR